MKKLFLILICIYTISMNFMSIKANNDYIKEDLNLYLEVIESVNKEYHVNYYILNEFDFNKTELVNIMSYNQYIDIIVSQDIISFKNSLIEDLKSMNNETIEIQLNNNFKSIYGKKNTLFNNNKNKMIIEYKYSGNTFDTTYNPQVDVLIINKNDHFEMDSYTDKFKNNNKTYTVIAEGKIIKYTGIVSDKTFTINFNL